MEVQSEFAKSDSLLQAEKSLALHSLNLVCTRFIGRADEILTAFLEPERTIHQFAVSLLS